jgi:hypothetical protein
VREILHRVVTVPMLSPMYRTLFTQFGRCWGTEAIPAFVIWTSGPDEPYWE